MKFLGMRPYLVPIRWFFLAVLIVTLGLIILVLLRPQSKDLISPLGSLILVLVTLTYAWFSHSVVQEMQSANLINLGTIEEMQKGRRQAATPLIHAEGVMSTSGSTQFFKISNVGSPAIGLVVVLQGLPVPPSMAAAGTILQRSALLVPGGNFQVEADLSPYALSSVDAYRVIGRYQNVLGEEFEAITEFPRFRAERSSRPGRGLPAQAVTVSVKAVFFKRASKLVDPLKIQKA